MRALGGRIRALPVCLPGVLRPAAILMRGKIGPIAERGDGGHENEGSGAMLLAIDVGNTQTVLGVYEYKMLLFRWRVATN